MNLYYTTTAGEDQERKDTYLSLGGYKSSTKVPNGRLNNLFGEITPMTVQNNQYQYIGLMLKNETGSAATNITIHFIYSETNTPYAKFEVAVVAPAVDSESVYYMENVDDMYSQPYSGTFYEANGVANKVSLGNLANGQMYGLWIRRIVDLDAINTDLEGKITKVGNIYQETSLDTEDEIQMIVTFNE